MHRLIDAEAGAVPLIEKKLPSCICQDGMLHIIFWNILYCIRNKDFRSSFWENIDSVKLTLLYATKIKKLYLHTYSELLSSRSQKRTLVLHCHVCVCAMTTFHCSGTVDMISGIKCLPGFIWPGSNDAVQEMVDELWSVCYREKETGTAAAFIFMAATACLSRVIAIAGYRD
jgi:hypothetical protein